MFSLYKTYAAYVVAWGCWKKYPTIISNVANNFLTCTDGYRRPTHSGSLLAKNNVGSKPSLKQVHMGYQPTSMGLHGALDRQFFGISFLTTISKR